MHIAFLLRLWPVYGGGETVTLRLANEFVKRQHQVSILYFEDSITNQHPFVDPRIQTFRIPEAHCDQHGYKKEYAAYVSDNLIRIVREQSFDIVINQWWPVEFMRDLRTKTSAKVIKCHHSAVYWLRPKPAERWKRIWQAVAHPFSKWHRKRLLRAVDCYLPYCDKFVFLSPSFVEQYKAMRHLDNQDGQLDSISNPLVYDECFPEEQLSAKAKEVLYVGRMVPSKRVELILKSWKQLQEQGIAHGWTLRIVGDGRSKKPCEKLVREWKLDNVSFEGFRLPLEFYRRASIFVMASANEGFPMTLIEAQQNGVVPIVMDAFLSLRDIISHGQNGLITPNGDSQAFAQAMAGLMTDDTYRTNLARTALHDCQRFSIRHIADQWEALFTSLLCRP